MKPLWDAIVALLGADAHWVSVDGDVTYPYRLVWPSTGLPGPDETLAGARGHVTGLVGVTNVALSAGAASTYADAARAELGEHEAVRLEVAGWDASIRWESFGSAGQDEQILVPATGTHPHTYVDLFRIDANRTPGGA